MRKRSSGLLPWRVPWCASWHVIGLVALAVLLSAGCDLLREPDVEVHIRGTVTEQPTGAPVESATVELVRIGFPGTTLHQTFTDAEGRYVLMQLVRGEDCDLLGLSITYPIHLRPRPYHFEFREPSCIESEQVFDVSFRAPPED